MATAGRDGPVPDWLRRLYGDSWSYIGCGLYSKAVTIGVDDAAEFLRHNNRNRGGCTEKSSYVKGLSDDMRRRAWVLTGEPILVGQDGEVFNGQNRCHACVLAKEPFDCVVTCNVSADAFGVIDQAKTRTGGALLARGDGHGGTEFKNATILAAVAAKVYAFHACGDPTGKAHRLRPADYKHYVCMKPELEQVATWTKANLGKFGAGKKKGVVGFWHYAFATARPLLALEVLGWLAKDDQQRKRFAKRGPGWPLVKALRHRLHEANRPIDERSLLVAGVLAWNGVVLGQDNEDVGDFDALQFYRPFPRVAGWEYDDDGKPTEPTR